MSDIGTRIIKEIIRQGMFTVSYPDPEAAHVFVWSSGSAEQLEALVDRSPLVQAPRREAAVYGGILQQLGAPDSGDPRELVKWAEAVAIRLR